MANKIGLFAQKIGLFAHPVFFLDYYIVHLPFLNDMKDCCFYQK